MPDVVDGCDLGSFSGISNLVARKYQTTTLAMARISVLQLETHFPRIAGDVGCAKTFQCELEIIIVPNATVAKIVTKDPTQLDLRPFQDALSKATGDLITTSCGFLAPLQSVLKPQCKVKFIASALGQLKTLSTLFSPEELSIITFDADKLGPAHLPAGCAAFELSIFGLDVRSHLREVISNDLPTLDENMASDDVCSAFEKATTSKTKAVILECTNLPPYKPSIRRVKEIAIYDILTAIESNLPNSVNPQFL